MKEEFENEKNINENQTVEETNKISKNKKGIIIGAVIGLVIGLILIFTFSSYKILFTPKKASFLTYLTSDVTKIKTLSESITDNKLFSFITDGNTKKMDLSINSKSKELAASTILNKDFFVLKLNNINENYLLLENKNLDKLWEQLGVQAYGLPSEINFEDNVLKLTNREKRKIYNFITKSVYNIVDNLENEKFILNSEKLIDINGENKTMKSVEVQISETDLLMLQKELLTSLEKEGIIDLLVNRVNSFGNSENLNKTELKEELDKYIAYLDYAKAYYDLQDEEDEYYIIYRMYCDESNNIIAREFTEKYTYEETLYEDIIARLITDENGFYELKVFNQEDYSSAYYNIISDQITTEENKQNHDITYAIEGFYVGYSEEGKDYEYVPLNSEVTYNLVIETLENGVNKLNLTDEYNIYSLNMQYDTNSANAEFISATDELKLKIDVQNDNITKEELINSGAVLVNEKTQEELMTEFGSIGNKITEIFAE